MGKYKIADEITVRVCLYAGSEKLIVEHYDLIEFNSGEDMVEAVVEDLLTNLEEVSNAN